MPAYRFTVPSNGRYRVDLLFAEIWFQQSGRRVFNVLLENQLVLGNLDLFAAIGHDVAVVYSFEVEVSDGILDINFGSVVEDPKISALAVTSVSLPDVTPSVALVSPNGGEWWLSGTSQTITWNATATIASLRIELGTLGGSRWSTITNSAPNTGSFAWLIPDTVSNQALIRITDSGGSGASDVSDAMFVLTRSALVNFTPVSSNPRLTPGPAGSSDENIRERGWVMYENGLYHMWYGGWRGTYNRSTPSLVDMGYATSSDGVNWTKYAGNPIQTNYWMEDFSVLKNGNTYYLYAEDEFTGDGARIDLYTSTDKLNWTRYGTVLTRGSRGWENDKVGTPVVWKEGSVWYMLYEGLGQAYAGQVGLATSSDGRNWTRNANNPVLTGPLGNQLDLAIDSILKLNGVYHAYAHYDTGGLNWVGGLFVSQDLISWTAYPNNPMTYTSPVIVANGTDYRMYGVVHIPVGHSQYHVAFGGSAGDLPPATLTLVSPNGGENWAVGTVQPILWNSTGTLASVKLEYSSDNGANWTTIVAATANDGGHDWAIPNAVSSQALVRVSDAQDADPMDRSDANFIISSDNTAPVISNVSAGNLTVASAVITWNTSEASDSQVEYGLTASYGSLSALDPNRVTAHTITLSGLLANTTYHYRARSRDAAGNLAMSSDFTFKTAATGVPIFSDNFTGANAFYYELAAYRTPTKGVQIVDDFSITAPAALAKSGESHDSTAHPTLAGLPAAFELGNYPNPFNLSARISFALPQDADVDLAVFDLMGRQVSELVQGPYPAGRHEVLWNGRNAAGAELSTGAYIIRLRYHVPGASFAVQLTRRVMLIK